MTSCRTTREASCETGRAGATSCGIATTACQTLHQIPEPIVAKDVALFTSGAPPALTVRLFNINGRFLAVKWSVSQPHVLPLKLPRFRAGSTSYCNTGTCAHWRKGALDFGSEISHLFVAATCCSYATLVDPGAPVAWAAPAVSRSEARRA